MALADMPAGLHNTAHGTRLLPSHMMKGSGLICAGSG